MYIVPYTYSWSKSPVGTRQYHTIDLLVQGACTTTLWNEENPDVEAILTSNDIYSTNLFVSESVTYAKVDLQRTSMTSMYRWTELPVGDTDTLCWRRFNHITEGGAAWLPVPAPFRALLDTIVEREAKGRSQ